MPPPSPLPLLILTLLLRSTFALPFESNFTLIAQRSQVPNLRKRSTGTAFAKHSDINKPPNMILYTTPVSIGAQNLNLLIDTASTMPWVFSTSLLPQPPGHKVYDPALSGTFAIIADNFLQAYDDGSWGTGFMGSDEWSVGNIAVAAQPFGLADKVSPSFRIGEPDGVLGFSLDAKLPGTLGALDSFIGLAVQAMDSPVFAAYLPAKADGAFDLGALRGERHTGDIMYAPIYDPNNTGWWMFQSEEYMVDGVVYPSPGTFAFVDTGTELMYLPTAMADQYWAAVPNSRYSEADDGYLFPCGQALPSISFRIGSVNFATIPGANIFTGFETRDGSACYGAVNREKTDRPLIALGLFFMSSFYCVFDIGTLGGARFGFSPIVPP